MGGLKELRELDLRHNPLPFPAQRPCLIQALTLQTGGRPAAAQARIVHVIGTTGLSADEEEAIAAAADKTVIVRSGNMSMGVILLSVLVEQAARNKAQNPSAKVFVYRNIGVKTHKVNVCNYGLSLLSK